VYADLLCERLLSTTAVRAQQPLRLVIADLLRQDQQQEYEAEQTDGFDDAHGDDDKDQSLALTFRDGATSGRPDETLHPGADHLGQAAGDADAQESASMRGRVRIQWTCLCTFFAKRNRSRV